MHDASHRNVTPAAELTWLLAGTAERRAQAADRIGELAGSVSYEAVAAEMDRHRARLILGGRDQALDDLAGPVGLHAMLFEALTQQAARTLEGAGIRALPLKGTALSLRAHGDPSLRISEDIDLLVDRDRLAPAIETLHELGYDYDPHEPRSAVHTVLRPEDPGLPRVEVHWRVHWYGDAFAGRLLDSSALDEDGIRVASPSAELVALMLFYAKDGFAGLRLPLDLGAYADRQRAELDAAEIADLITGDREIGSAVATAGVVARDVVGLDMPILQPPLSARQGRAARLANWSLQGDADQIAATVRLVDALLTPPGTRLRFARNRLRPFQGPGRNALYVSKTLLRWLPALSSTRAGRTPNPVPALRVGSER
jgi:Uncharacterised nucleotidyltransferase